MTEGKGKGAVNWKLYGALFSVVVGIYKLSTATTLKDQGDAAIFFVAAIILAADHLKPERFSECFREFFKDGDQYVRWMVFGIAIGGALLVIKKVFDTHLISDQWDFLFKRSAIPAVLVTLVVYATTLLSKITYQESELSADEMITRYEAQLYWMVAAFSVSIFTWLMGAANLDGLLGEVHDAKRLGLWFDPEQLSWNPTLARVWKCATLMSAIWAMYAAAAVISRYFERAFRDRVRSKAESAMSSETIVASMDR